jgi:hypothetical protein
MVTGIDGEGKSAGVLMMIGNAKITTPANAVAHNNLRASAMPGSFSGAGGADGRARTLESQTLLERNYHATDDP